MADWRLPETDVWLAFKGSNVGHPFYWSIYFVRTTRRTEKLGFFFHGANDVRKRSAATRRSDSSPFQVDQLTSSPRFGEVFKCGDSSSPCFGLIFVSDEIFKPVAPTGSSWRVCVDLGTTNTSVAFQETEQNPKVLSYNSWAAPLIHPQSLEGTRTAVPGWFLQAVHVVDERKIHMGFFPTLLGYRKQVLNANALLSWLENPVG